MPRRTRTTRGAVELGALDDWRPDREVVEPEGSSRGVVKRLERGLAGS
jgi:hypothetical protein